MSERKSEIDKNWRLFGYIKRTSRAEKKGTSSLFSSETRTLLTRPPMFFIVSAGMSKEDAMKAYIAEAKKQVEKFGHEGQDKFPGDDWALT